MNTNQQKPTRETIQGMIDKFEQEKGIIEGCIQALKYELIKMEIKEKGIIE